jgi:hypothetical protein
MCLFLLKNEWPCNALADPLMFGGVSKRSSGLKGGIHRVMLCLDGLVVPGENVLPSGTHLIQINCQYAEKLRRQIQYNTWP